MKKILPLLVVALSVSTGVWAAPDRTDQWDAGIKIGGVLPSTSGESNVAYVGGELAYGINEWSAVGVSAGWTDAKVRTQNGNNVEVNGGKYGMFPIFADLILRAPTPPRYDYLAPYGVLGFGTIITHRLSIQDLNTYALGSKIDSGLAVKLGLGLDWYMNANWIFNMELNYVLSGVTVDIINNNNNAVIDSKDLDYLYLGVGLKYLYN